MSLQVLVIVGVDAGPTTSADRLLDLLGWVRREQPGVELHVLLLRGGSQIHRFHELAPTTVVDWYDRRADLRGAAVVLRGKRRQRWLAKVIERYASVTLPRRLPRRSADAVLVWGWEAARAGPLGAGPRVPRVVLLDDGEVELGRLPRHGHTVLVEPAAAPVDDALAQRVWVALERAVTG